MHTVELGDTSNGIVELPVDRARPLVCVIDDHQLVVSLLLGLLRRAGYEAEGGYADSAQEVRQRIEALRPDLVVLDCDLGPLDSGLPFVEVARRVHATVVALTASDDPLLHATYLEAGAVGVVQKTVGPADILATIELALAGHDVTPPAERHRLVAELRLHRQHRGNALRPFDHLTTRESQVLGALCDGLSASSIAEDWIVSLPTVRSHIRSILLKLEVNSQLEAVAKARRAGWVPPDSSILMMTPPPPPTTISSQERSLG